MLNWPVWNDLEVLYRKAGRTIPETIRLQLLLRADDARNLLALIEALGKQPDGGGFRRSEVFWMGYRLTAPRRSCNAEFTASSRSMFC
jgi:hypothetical protein